MAKHKLTESQKRIAERRMARKLALFMIYQWQITDYPFDTLYVQLQQDKESSADFRKSDPKFLHSLVKCALHNADEIQALIEPHLDHRKLNQVDMIEQAALRLATCELQNHMETPYKVVVNEAINLTKKFGAEQGHKFVNGVLKKLVSELRTLELSAESSKKKSK